MSVRFNPEQFDVRILRLPDMPPEWQAPDDELLAWLKPDERGLTSRAQLHAEEDIVAERWFLVKNTFGFRCKRCRSGTLISPGSLPGTIHPYITYACIERPFNGLNEVLMFWRQAIGERLDPSAFEDRKKSVQEREQLKAGFEALTMRLGEGIRPITPEKARELYLKIEMVTGRDLAWEDFQARYIRRYREFLREQGWDYRQVGPAQRKLVHEAARREYALRERR